MGGILLIQNMPNTQNHYHRSCPYPVLATQSPIQYQVGKYFAHNFLNSRYVLACQAGINLTVTSLNQLVLPVHKPVYVSCKSPTCHSEYKKILQFFSVRQCNPSIQQAQGKSHKKTTSSAKPYFTSTLG